MNAADSDEQKVIETLEKLRYPPDRQGLYPAASHAEAKVAYWMRTAGVNHVVAVINNPKGVCAEGPQSCDALVRRLLPVGAVLEVWEPGKSEPKKMVEGKWSRERAL